MDLSPLKVYERVLERLVASEWATEYAFQSGGTISLKWTTEGQRHAGLLRRIVWAFQLNENVSKGVRFDSLCENALTAHTRPTIDIEIAKFWRECMKDLHLTRDEIDFCCLLQGIVEFGPKDHVADQTIAELIEAS